MSLPYEHPYEFEPHDGPAAGSVIILPRRYDWFGSRDGGWYVWVESIEGYAWQDTEPAWGDGGMEP